MIWYPLRTPYIQLWSCTLYFKQIDAWNYCSLGYFHSINYH